MAVDAGLCVVSLLIIIHYSTVPTSPFCIMCCFPLGNMYVQFVLSISLLTACIE